MPVFLRSLIAVIAGLVVGSIVNMGIITFGGKLIPPPSGANVATMEGLAAAMHLFEPKHFLTPFLAHALGTFVGALVAALIASKRPLIPACIVGGLFLLGGIAAVFMLPAPAWFNATDLLLAYAPATWLALKLAQRRNTARA